MITPDGIQAAADREIQFHPKVLPAGTPISAWQRRADTLKTTVAKVNDLEQRLAALEAKPPVPFPFGGV